MTEVSALPASGGVLFDARDDGRSLRVGWHPSQHLVVLSVWRTNQCVATCQLTRADAAALVADLAAGLAASPPEPWTPPTYGKRSPWLRRLTQRARPDLRLVPDPNSPRREAPSR
jgi:hypothetical protein